MNLQSVEQQTMAYAAKIMDWLSSPEFYSQAVIIVVAIIVAYFFSAFFKRHLPILQHPPSSNSMRVIRTAIYQSRQLLFPLFVVFCLFISIELSQVIVKQSWLVRIAESLAVIVMIYALITHFVENLMVESLLKWIAIPVAILQIFGWLDNVIDYLESMYVEIGNIKITAYGFVRVVIFGLILFWLGRISNRVGQNLIRRQERLDLGTREVLTKLYQVGLFVVIFFLLLQVMGINITALAVFGGALGVGLGFGLQAIASNFISGIILLLDRSLSVGDYIELADGRKGSIRELNMRSTLLETFDGKDIMVPNEQFITTSFTNWTHKNQKQRYSIELQVSYQTDLHALFDHLRQVVAAHPRVLSGDQIPLEERPDAEIASFGESGVNILIEFWMEGIDDGKNRVGGDLLLMIWDALKQQQVEIPYPQRDVHIIRDKETH
ncbi:MAG: mechanosensitive ion channel [Gammaproteobacteria bacterium]|nr:mechanosensitive ion channel [Gammaproteobacteria bacterium]MDH5730054.1 mechanosensitive ion channel [Gammaproteobacteria bacterium]